MYEYEAYTCDRGRCRYDDGTAADHPRCHTGR